jgi:two-component system, chemotaxis family, protein-glutamate methylesterase/glutaminase
MHGLRVVPRGSWVVAIGASAGGVAALPIVLSTLPANFPAAVLVVQHLDPDVRSHLARVLQRGCALPVRDAVADVTIEPGIVYVAPPGLHLLLRDGRVVLTDTARVHFSRPSIDVLFDSIAAAYGPRAVGVILTGSGSDGAAGLRSISRAGGRTIVQEPATAEYSAMPSAAGATGCADFTLPLSRIGPALTALVEDAHD